MVSWRRAFRGALAILAWSIVWVVIGILVAALGLAVLAVNPFMAVPPIIAGYVIAGLGAYAALLKVLAEVTAEEVERRVKK